MLRDFSNANKEEIKRYIDKTGKYAGEFLRNTTFTDYFGKRTYDYKLSLSTQTTTINKMDSFFKTSKEIALEQLNKIFDAVDDTDLNYGDRLYKTFQFLCTMEKSMKDLEEMIHINSGSSDMTGLFSNPKEVQKKAREIREAILQAAIATFKEVDDEGNETYDWDKISELLHKKPQDVSNTEYEAMMLLLSGLIHDEGNGDYSIDTDILQKFIEAGYEPGGGEFKTANLQTQYVIDPHGIYTETFKPSDTFKKLVEMYTSRTNILVEALGDCYFDNITGEHDAKENYLNSEQYLTNILNIVTTQMGKVYLSGVGTYLDAQKQALNSKVQIKISKNIPDQPYYLVETPNGNLGRFSLSNPFDIEQKTIGGKAYAYQDDLDSILHDTINENANAMKSDGGVESGISVGKDVRRFLMDQVLDVTEMATSMPAKIAIDAGKLSVDLYEQNQGINEQNRRADNIISQNDQNSYFRVFCAGGSIIKNPNGSVKINSIHIDNKKLKYEIDNYNCTKGTSNSISIDSVRSDFYEFANGGKVSSRMEELSKWVSNHKDIMALYRP